MFNLLIAILTPTLGSCSSIAVEQGVKAGAGWAWIEQCGVQCKAREVRHAGPGGDTVIRRDDCGNIAIIQQHG